MNNQDLLHQLRRHTRSLHDQLDSHPWLQPLIHKEITRQAYAQALSALYSPQKWLEVQIQPKLAEFYPNHRYALRYPCLASDLARLSQVTSEPIIENPHPLETPSQLLGYLYVLEGSKQGAKYLQRHLQQQQWPMSFFQSALDQSQSGWKGFVELVKMDSLDSESVIAAAVEAFQLFYQLLSQSHHLIEGKVSCSINTASPHA